MPTDAGGRRGAAAEAGRSNDGSARPTRAPKPPRGGRGHNIQAVNNAVLVLKAVAGLGRAASLREIAEAAGLTSSRAHRYLTSLCQTGLVAHAADSGRYDLGDTVVALGVVALGRIDPVRLGTEALIEINAQTGLDSHLNIWGTNGPTVVKWEQGRLGYAVKIREGRNLPILLTSTGRLFLAYMPPEETRPFVERELDMFSRAAPGAPRIRRADVAKLRQEVREHGLARALGELNSSICALSAPAFDRDGRLAVSLTVLGMAGSFNTDYDGDVAHSLRSVAENLSRRLGAPAAG